MIDGNSLLNLIIYEFNNKVVSRLSWKTETDFITITNLPGLIEMITDRRMHIKYKIKYRYMQLLCRTKFR